LSATVPSSRADRDVPPFPTRRSSDLDRLAAELPVNRRDLGFLPARHDQRLRMYGIFFPHAVHIQGNPQRPFQIDRQHLAAHDIRSEEHTSELQSRENLVCRLLLEKKK